VILAAAFLLAGFVEIGLLVLVALVARRAPRRPPVESYVRSSLVFDGWTYEPGIEWREGDDRERLECYLTLVTEGMFVNAKPTDTPEERGREVGRLIEIAFLGEQRAYFVEVFAPDGTWSQTFQPYGVPRW
jgi:hypothetical protein